MSSISCCIDKNEAMRTSDVLFQSTVFSKLPHSKTRNGPGLISAHVYINNCYQCFHNTRVVVTGSSEAQFIITEDTRYSNLISKLKDNHEY